jgi:hypothetical protein
MYSKDLTEIGVDDLFSLPEKDDPFRESIEMFKFVTDEKTPMEKMNLMVVMSQKIV